MTVTNLTLSTALIFLTVLMSLNRSQFDSACKAYIDKYSSTNDKGDVKDELRAKFPAGWSWNEHKVRLADHRLSLPVHLLA
jgi:hypothetical protein